MTELLIVDGRYYMTTLKIANHIKALLVRVQLLKYARRFREADKVAEQIEDELGNALFELEAYEIDKSDVNERRA